MLADKFEKGSFVLVNIAAQRARQLMQGASPLLRSQSRKPAAIAVREIQEGLVEYYTPDQAPFTEAFPEDAEDEPQEVDLEE